MNRRTVDTRLSSAPTHLIKREPGNEASGSDAQEKKSDFLHGSVRRYKTLRSSTNCGCGHLMTHFVELQSRNSS